MNFFKNFLKKRESMIFLVVMLIFFFLCIASPVFLTRSNLLAVLIGLSVETIIAVAMTNLLISGGFDLSVGSVLCFSGMIAALCWRIGIPQELAIILGILSGMAVGIFNGVLVAHLGIAPFVVTLASLNIFRGIVYAITEGKSIAGLPGAFRFLGQKTVFGVQMPIIFAILLVIIGDLALRKIRFFRQNYYIGGNEKAAQLSGINVRNMKIFNYMLAGLFSGFAGVVQAGRLGSAMVTSGQNMEMRVLTAVIIGGASLQGGEGTILGAFLGSMLMALVTNAVNLLGVNVYWQTFIVGLTLLIAVLIDSFGAMQRNSKAFNKKKSSKEE
jgi:ribose transport system permease protein